MARKRLDEWPKNVIDSLIRLREEADDMLRRTRALCTKLDERLREARWLASRAPRRQKLQKSRRAS